MILVVGLSPAWQRTLVFDDVRLSKVNRAKHVLETASGKGVNVTRVAQTLGERVLLLTVAGAARGRLLERSLRVQKIAALIVKVKAETRICQTLIGGSVVTELVEEAGELSRVEVAEVLARFDREVRRAKLVVLTGTVPKGCGEDFYARLIRRTGVPVLLDTQGQQLVNALLAKPFLVRINRDELAAVPGLGRRGVEWFVISDGAGQVSATRGHETFMVTPPRVRTVNTVGSGDAMMAGIACGCLRGLSMREAARFGVACGAANALTAEPGHVRLADVRRLCSTLHKRDPIV